MATIADLQATMARNHAAEMGCPVAKGIFTWIAAHASEELETKRRGSGAPYWRILKSDGSLNPTFPGGVKRPVRRLAKEGIASEKRGVKTRVVGLDDLRYHF